MKRTLISIIFLCFASAGFAQNEVKPDGDKLIYILLVLLVALPVIWFFNKKGGGKKPLFTRKRVTISLQKNRVYFPGELFLKVTNTGNTDLDLDRPLLVLDNFWLKRKFRLKGMQNHSFYPLYLEKGKTHTLNIDLARFYAHDKKLKKYPKATIILHDVNGKRLGSKSVYLRKTLVKF